MSRLSKKRQLILKTLEIGKIYKLDEAVACLKSLPQANFKDTLESIDVSINLGVDPRKSDQVVRGATLLPKGTGKIVRVAVFAQGLNAEAAKEMGADIVGMADLADSIKAGNIDFDVVIASPDAMGVVGRLGPILGPRGLMPNPKVGTVTSDVASAVTNAKSGQVRYRTDKNGIIHCSVGKMNFSSSALQVNIEALLVDLRKAKPSTSKGVYIKKLTISSTMGPGLTVDLASLTY